MFERIQSLLRCLLAVRCQLEKVNGASQLACLRGLARLAIFRAELDSNTSQLARPHDPGKL